MTKINENKILIAKIDWKIIKSENIEYKHLMNFSKWYEEINKRYINY